MFGRHKHGFGRGPAFAPQGFGRGGGGFGPGPFGGPRERGKRAFDHGTLRLVILHLINEKPSHGYELIKAVEELTGGAYSPSPGVIYPTLTLLEELGQAQVTEEAGNRKLYSITDAGKTALAAEKPLLDAILARVEGLKGRGLPGPGVQRALENFRTALHLRLRAALSAEQSEALVQLLDETARKIEKI